MPTTATSEDIKRDRRRSTAAMFAVSACAAIAVVLAGLGDRAISADKYTVQVPGGLAFSEFRGYEDWPVISISDNNGKFASILGNPVMMDALRAGVPGNGKPFPDGAKMAKIHWTPKTQADVPRSAEGAGYSCQRRFHGEGQQEVRGQRWMGMGLIRLRRSVRYVQPRHRGGPVRRRATTRSAGSRATHW